MFRNALHNQRVELRGNRSVDAARSIWTNAMGSDNHIAGLPPLR